MNAKKIFVDVASFQGNDKQNPIGCVLQQVSLLMGEACASVVDADIIVVGTSQAAMTALSVSGTSKVVLAAVKERGKDELIVGANLRGNYPDRFSMYGLLPMPEMAVKGVEEFFERLKQK